MQLTLQASVAAMVNAQGMMAADDEIQCRAARGNWLRLDDEARPADFGCC
jgi:hypothetical protein